MKPAKPLGFAFQAVLVSLLCANATHATDFFWDNYSGDGSFQTRINWNPYPTPANVPGLGDTATFNGALAGSGIGNNTVDVAHGTMIDVMNVIDIATVDLTIGDGTTASRFDLDAGNSLVIGDTPGDTATLNLQGGWLDTFGTSVGGRASFNVVGAGTRWDSTGVSISGDTTTNTAGIGVGQSAQIYTNGSPLDVGSDTGSGRIVVDGTPEVMFGPPAHWDGIGTLDVGPTATSGFNFGSVTLQTGGQMSANSASVHGTSNVDSEIIVKTGGDLTVVNTLDLGPNSRIELTGSNSRVSAGQLTGSETGLDWASGTLEITGEIVKIDTVNGHSVLGSNLIIGADQGLELTYVGHGSQTMLVGNQGTGSVTIQDGGQLTQAALAALGGQGTASGTVTVQDSGSHWQVADIRLGSSGSSSGTINILNGGRATASADVLLAGFDATASGTVLVDGFGSTFDVAGSVSVGGQPAIAGGTGTLTVDNGGVVNVGGTLRVWPGGTLSLLGSEINTDSFIAESGGTVTHDDGTLTVDGGTFEPGTTGYILDGTIPAEIPVVSLINGASGNLSGTSHIGDHQRGRLEILSGSTMTMPVGWLGVGRSIGGQGEVIVHGQGSVLDTSEGLVVGRFGDGVLRVLNGGTVFDPASPVEPIGQFAGSTGLAEVVGSAPNGTPSTWTTNGELQVGHQGVGALVIADGGRVIALAGATIAEQTGSAGSGVEVAGVGPAGPSLWDIAGQLYVGGGSFGPGDSGELVVLGGGRVAVTDQMTVYGTGVVNVDGLSTVEIGTGTPAAGAVNVLAGGTLNGSGQINGFVHNDGGTVAPGTSVGVLNIDGIYGQTGAGTLQIELGGTAPGQFDALSMSIEAVLSGLLEISLVPGFTPSIGDGFAVITTAGGVFDRFDQVVFPAIPSVGLGIDYLSDPNVVTIRALLKGDLNGDGFVGIADLNIVLGDWNQDVIAGVWALGDPSGDGYIGIEDLNTVLGNWNAGTPPSADANIPEPASLGLLLAGSVMLLRRN